MWHIGPRPSRQSRNRCIRSKISRYHFDLWTGWIRCNCDAHRKQVDVKQLYNPVPQTVWVSWSQLQLEFEFEFESVRTSSRQSACGPRWPLVEYLNRMKKKCCFSQRNLGSICCSLFCLQLTSHTQPFCNPFENKVWEVYFSKEVCSFVNIVDYVPAYICMHIVTSRLCNNWEDLGAMAMKGYSIFPKSPRLGPHHQIVGVISRTLIDDGVGGSYLSPEIKSVYSTVDWADSYVIVSILI